ncbi:hypothetical protein HQ40_10625 [Porphyromonas gulae]|nr:hypothetical protein HQ49_00320 [Porphyromonas gulae]KGN72732.1 hypothetical protein HQ40_10625 [Porphyromonas gulae]KGN86951.1 hypothetical protein HQ46_10130 [Porphyromonas gulae]KGN94621.1 hypothetical protein HR15_00930 [Porphyromonas gulae]KGO03267.1 hypothetical protein HQ42_01760 [Porphyromonas gulae]
MTKMLIFIEEFVKPQALPRSFTCIEVSGCKVVSTRAVSFSFPGHSFPIVYRIMSDFLYSNPIH